MIRVLLAQGDFALQLVDGFDAAAQKRGAFGARPNAVTRPIEPSATATRAGCTGAVQRLKVGARGRRRFLRPGLRRATSMALSSTPVRANFLGRFRRCVLDGRVGRA